jgi:hypothetical protein
VRKSWPAEVKTASGAGRGRGVLGCGTDSAGGALSCGATCELVAGIIQGGSNAIGGSSVRCSKLRDAMGGYAMISGGGVSYDLPVGRGAHASGGEDGLGAGECGSRLSEMDGVVIGTRVNPVFWFLHCEPAPDCGLDAVMGLQLFLVGRANNASSQHLVDLSKPFYGSHGRTGRRLRQPHHGRHRGRFQRRAAWHKRRRRTSRQPSRGRAGRLRRWQIWWPRGRGPGGR